MPQFNGMQMTPPIYKPQLKNANNKIIAVVYPAEKEDGINSLAKLDSVLYLYNEIKELVTKTEMVETIWK